MNLPNLVIVDKHPTGASPEERLSHDLQALVDDLTGSKVPLGRFDGGGAKPEYIEGVRARFRHTLAKYGHAERIDVTVSFDLPTKRMLMRLCDAETDRELRHVDDVIRLLTRP